MDQDIKLYPRNSTREQLHRLSGDETTTLNEIPEPAHGADADDDDQLYQTLLHNMHHGFALCQIQFGPERHSPEFLISEVNAAFTHFSFATVGDLIGQRLHDIFPELAAACRFAAISSGGSSKPTQYRVYQTLCQQVFEATITVLDQHRAAIMLVDVSNFLGGRQRSVSRLENSYSDDYRGLNEGSKLIKTPESDSGDQQEELQRHKSDLEMLNHRLVQTNTTITVLAQQIDQKRDELEKKIAHRVSSQIMPLIEELLQDRIPQGSKAKLDVVAAYLRSLTPGVTRGGNIIMALSPMELRVAMMIKKGFSTEESARMLHLSPETVKTHRRSIRRKLNIRNSPVNLATYLRFNLGPVRHSN